MVTVGRLILLTIFITTAGCSLFISSPDPKASKDKNLSVNFSYDPWIATDARESDFAWAHERAGDVMMVNSFCGEFQSLPLETLALKTFQDYQGFRPLGKNTLEWKGREAFEMEAEAFVDGVKVIIHLRNYRRDHCYYDFVLISPRGRTEESLKAFNTMLSGVRF
jgi:hypothetical protein